MIVGPRPSTGVSAPSADQIVAPRGGIVAVGLRSDDLAREAQWYSALLDARVTLQWPHRMHLGWADEPAGLILHHLPTFADRPADGPFAGPTQLTLRASSARALDIHRRRAAARGLRPIDARQIADQRVLGYRDPLGNRIELTATCAPEAAVARDDANRALRWDHLTVWIRDPVLTLDWYRLVLGARVCWTGRDARTGQARWWLATRGCGDERDGGVMPQLVLAHAPEARPPLRETLGVDYVVWRHADPTALFVHTFKRLRSAGIVPVRGLCSPDAWILDYRDPEGNALRLTAPRSDTLRAQPDARNDDGVPDDPRARDAGHELDHPMDPVVLLRSLRDTARSDTFAITSPSERRKTTHE
ncbi:MAG: VOC family protein [Acidobacteriota bacterium]